MTATIPLLPLLPAPFSSSLVETEGRDSNLSLGDFPVPGEDPSPRRIPFSLPMLESRPPHSPPQPEKQPGKEKPAVSPAAPGPDGHGDFTDADLTAALAPLLAAAGGGQGFPLHDDSSFEAILRATFRRTLAEHQKGPFQHPDFGHRMLWRMQALFSSRSYEEVLAEKIRRSHVEEVYLLDRDRLSLVSYASSDPARHSNPRRVGSFSRQLALRIRDETGALQLGFELGEGRRTFVRAGRFCYMVAMVRGEVNDLMKADLDFALKRIENRYRHPFVEGHPLLKELQPLLEECLLIHSPAAPAAS